MLQWLKRVDADEVGRHNGTITFNHDGELYVLLQTSRDGTSTSVSTTRQRDGGYISELTVTRITSSDAGLYVCVVTGRYGVRSYRAAALAVYSASGQPRVFLLSTLFTIFPTNYCSSKQQRYECDRYQKLSPNLGLLTPIKFRREVGQTSE